MSEPTLAEEFERLEVMLVKCMEGENAHKPGPCPGPNADRPTRREPAPAHDADRTRRPSPENGWGDVEAEHRERLEKDPEYRAAEDAAKERHRRANTPPSSAANKSPLHATLEKSPVTHAQLLGGGVSKSYLVEIGNDTWGVWKPKDGESADPRAGRRGVPHGTQYRREIAASRVAEILGFDDLVPTTTVRNQGGDLGSVQVFVPDAKEAADAGDQMFDGPEDAARAAAFDYLIGHLDRHAYNWMVAGGDKLALIDNGLAFPTHYDGRDFFNMRLMLHAAKKELLLPDMTGLAGKWPDVEKALEDAGLEPEAVRLAGERFAALMSGEYRRVGDLPSLLDSRDNLAEMVKQDRHARRVMYGASHAS